jgi:hypothetical protein
MRIKCKALSNAATSRAALLGFYGSSRFVVGEMPTG